MVAAVSDDERGERRRDRALERAAQHVDRVERELTEARTPEATTRALRILRTLAGGDRSARADLERELGVDREQEQRAREEERKQEDDAIRKQIESRPAPVHPARLSRIKRCRYCDRKIQLIEAKVAMGGKEAWAWRPINWGRIRWVLEGQGSQETIVTVDGRYVTGKLVEPQTPRAERGWTPHQCGDEGRDE